MPKDVFSHTVSSKNLCVRGYRIYGMAGSKSISYKVCLKHCNLIKRLLNQEEGGREMTVMPLRAPKVIASLIIQKGKLPECAKP